MATSRRNFFLWIIGFCAILILWQYNMGGIFSSEGQESNKIDLDLEVISGVLDQGQDDIQEMDQTDKRLWEYVRSHHITLPSTLDYSFGKDAQVGIHEGGIDDVVYPLFDNKKGGFFVEIGGFDGIQSHTLKLEREFGWTGLLAECNPNLVPTLKKVNRKAYIADVCLSTQNHPTKMKMNIPDQSSASGTLGNGSNLFPPGTEHFTTFEVQTVPLYSIFAAIDVKEVDLFIFDIQGMELEILKNFPFELVLVKVWVIEVYFYSAEQRNWLKTFMASKGYPEDKFKELKSQWGDFMFVHKSF